MLGGTGRPQKQLVSNFLRVVGVDDSARKDWESAWDRVALATYSSSRETPIKSDTELDPDSERIFSEDLIYDVVADVVDIVRAVLVQVTSETTQELKDMLEQTRAVFADIERLKEDARELTARAKLDARELTAHAKEDARDARELTARAKLDAAEIVKQAHREAEEIVKSATKSRSGPTVKPQSAETPVNPVKRQPAASAKPEPLKLDIGDRVNHDKYGIGTVIHKDGNGVRETVTVDFGNEPVRLMLIGGIPMPRIDGPKPGADKAPPELGRTPENPASPA